MRHLLLAVVLLGCSCSVANEEPTKFTHVFEVQNRSVEEVAGYLRGELDSEYPDLLIEEEAGTKWLFVSDKAGTQLSAEIVKRIAARVRELDLKAESPSPK